MPRAAADAERGRRDEVRDQDAPQVRNAHESPRALVQAKREKRGQLHRQRNEERDRNEPMDLGAPREVEPQEKRCCKREGNGGDVKRQNQVSSNGPKASHEHLSELAARSHERGSAA